jgi:light-regulated signal transduction histidine kinase (bacteriophytochrome)
LKHRTAKLEIANRDLGAANKELEAFSASVAYDLRWPLRAIDGFSNILLEDHVAELSDDGRHLLSVIMTSSNKMN